MRIDWNINKKTGNIRPVLTYSVTLDDYEKALAMPPLRIQSSIPEPPDAWQEFCYPEQLERQPDHKPSSFYELETPSHRGKAWPQTLRLPWRADNAYPEVEASFRLLRDAFEKQLKEACASLPMKEENSISSTPAARRTAAPAALGARFLRYAQAVNAGQPAEL